MLTEGKIFKSNNILENVVFGSYTLLLCGKLQKLIAADTYAFTLFDFVFSIKTND